MALTSQQKTKAYRERLKLSGGKTIAVDLNSDQVMALNNLRILGFDADNQNIVKAIVSDYLGRVGAIRLAQAEFIELGHRELIDAYLENEVKRNKPLTALEFLNQQGNKQNEI